MVCAQFPTVKLFRNGSLSWITFSDTHMTHISSQIHTNIMLLQSYDIVANIGFPRKNSAKSYHPSASMCTQHMRVCMHFLHHLTLIWPVYVDEVCQCGWQRPIKTPKYQSQGDARGQINFSHCIDHIMSEYIGSCLLRVNWLKSV